MKNIILAATLLLSSINVANANLIKVNGQVVNALDLNGIATSFEDFYNYDANGKASANTGYESQGVVSIFLAELNNEIGIFTIAQGFKGAYGLDMSVAGTEGDLSFVEEIAEQSLNTASWTFWGAKTDGSIFSGLNSDSWSVDFDFSNMLQLTNYEVSTFSGTTATVAVAGLLSERVTVAKIPEPVSLTLLGLGLLALAVHRRTSF
jgi:hypothetical protein